MLLGQQGFVILME